MPTFFHQPRQKHRTQEVLTCGNKLNTAAASAQLFSLQQNQNGFAEMVTSVEAKERTLVTVDPPQNDQLHNAHKIRTARVDVTGVPTTFILQPFADRIFVIVTQFDKLGTILSASVDVTLAGAETYTVNVLMGKRDVPELEFCARSIMSLIKSSGSTTPLLLSLALESHDLPTIRAIIEQVSAMPVW